MSKAQLLRCLVNERLTAAAEEIFALFERTIAEYEEELCRSKEENQRKQQLLDSVGTHNHKTDVQVQATVREAVSPCLEPEEDPDMGIKLEDDEFPFIPILVKHEEYQKQSSLLQQRQTEHREEAQAEDCGGADAHGLLESELEGQIEISSDSENEEDWDAPCSSSAPQMDTEGDDFAFKNDLDISSPDMTLDRSVSEAGGEVQNHECLACGKAFQHQAHLQRHMTSHTGEKPFSCPVCNKGFTRKTALKLHMSIHTGEAAFSCSDCDSRFTQKHHLVNHMRIHNTERPFRCPICNKCFTRKYRLTSHIAAHTGERPFSCPVCEKSFTRKDNLSAHMTMHTGNRPFICAICNSSFTRKDRLTAHMATHTAEKI